mmetsp:Transcript_8269/g.14180  ORF Transcript_8269/g.14180 Transcript_8269/m.14180 type:complete len:215 (+) Transcript_8269:234-878(+)
MSKIQLYSLATPNGQKIGIALEELGIPYEPHRVDIMKGEQFTDSFKSINPNSKIPAIVDPDGPDGKPLTVFETGAILLYLAEKTGKFLPKDVHKKYEVIEWLFWQVAGVGPMFGQLGHFLKYAPEKIEYGINRYATETRRILGVLDKKLEGKDWVAGDEYTIADIAIFPFIVCLDKFYNASELLKLHEFVNVKRWLDKIAERPAVQRGMLVCCS